MASRSFLSLTYRVYLEVLPHVFNQSLTYMSARPTEGLVTSRRPVIDDSVDTPFGYVWTSRVYGAPLQHTAHNWFEISLTNLLRITTRSQST